MQGANLTVKDRSGNLIASAIVGATLLMFLAVVTFVLPRRPLSLKRGVLRFDAGSAPRLSRGQSRESKTRSCSTSAWKV